MSDTKAQREADGPVDLVEVTLMWADPDRTAVVVEIENHDTVDVKIAPWDWPGQGNLDADVFEFRGAAIAYQGKLAKWDSKTPPLVLAPGELLVSLPVRLGVTYSLASETPWQVRYRIFADSIGQPLRQLASNWLDAYGE